MNTYLTCLETPINSIKDRIVSLNNTWFGRNVTLITENTKNNSSIIFGIIALVVIIKFAYIIFKIKEEKDIKFETSSLKRSLHSLSAENEELKEKVKSLNGSLKDKSTTVEILNNDIRKLESNIEKLNKEYKEIKKQEENACCEKTALAAQNQHLAAELKDESAKNKQLESQILSLTNQLIELKK